MNTIDENLDVKDTLKISDKNKIHLYYKVQSVIKNVKIKKYMKERDLINKEGMSFFGGITGKNNLQFEKMRNIKLKMELLQAQKERTPEKFDLTEMMADIYACAIVDLGGKFTPEMSNIYNNIKEKYYWENNSEISDKELYMLANEKISKGNSYLPVIHKEFAKGIFGNIKMQTEFLKLENKKIENQIILERGKSQFETFSYGENNMQFIIPTNVKKPKKNLTNA